MDQTQSKVATKSATAAKGPASKLKSVKETSSSTKIASSMIGPDLLEKMHAWSF